MTREWKHWREVEPRDWRWPNFSPQEMACRGTGRLLVDYDAMDKLQDLRRRLGVPMIVRSAYRSPEHNRAVSGAKRSQHLLGRAFDIAMSNHDPRAFEITARACGFTGFGFYPRAGFMHIDTGPAREWGKRFAPRDDSRFEPEPKPERAKEAATATVGGVAGAAVAETALREVAPYLPGPWGSYAMIAAIALPLAIGAGLALWRLFGRRSQEIEA